VNGTHGARGSPLAARRMQPKARIRMKKIPEDTEMLEGRIKSQEELQLAWMFRVTCASRFSTVVLPSVQPSVCADEKLPGFHRRRVAIFRFFLNAIGPVVHSQRGATVSCIERRLKPLSGQTHLSATKFQKLNGLRSNLPNRC